MFIGTQVCSRCVGNGVGIEYTKEQAKLFIERFFLKADNDGTISKEEKICLRV